jgi:hypothetical protein
VGDREPPRRRLGRAALRPRVRLVTHRGRLRAGDAALFRRGPDGAHQLINRFADLVRVVVVSTVRHPEVARYPDSGELAVFAGAPPVPGEQAPIELTFDPGTRAAEPARAPRPRSQRGQRPG